MITRGRTTKQLCDLVERLGRARSVIYVALDMRAAQHAFDLFLSIAPADREVAPFRVFFPAQNARVRFVSVNTNTDAARAAAPPVEIILDHAARDYGNAIFVREWLYLRDIYAGRTARPATGKKEIRK